MNSVERGMTVVPFTCGVIPTVHNRDKFRPTMDSILVAIAARELYLNFEQQGRNPEGISIPGATFFGKEIDAEYMRDVITNPHPVQPEEQRIPEEKVISNGDCTNTPTQMAWIREQQKTGKLGFAAIVCASWQAEDAAALMEGNGINGALYTDKGILYEKGKFKNFFDRQEQTPTYKLKKDGTVARIFRVLNRIDKKGRVRTLMTKVLGVGIADYKYRGTEKNVDHWLEKQHKKIAKQRQLHQKDTL
jgi:hypothetical protein